MDLVLEEDFDAEQLSVPGYLSIKAPQGSLPRGGVARGGHGGVPGRIYGETSL